MNTRQQNTIRQAVQNDLPDLKNIIDSTELFPSDLLDDMIMPFFQQENGSDFWVVYEQNKIAIAVAYFAHERMTKGTYNLLLIAVHKDFQGQGIGKTLLHHIEALLKGRDIRILLVETSGLPEFERTRAFYMQNEYRVEAKIAEFYAKGEDKIIFWKSLQQ